MIEAHSGGRLLPNLILFGRVLRGLGLDVNPGRMMDVAHALEFVEIGRKADFYNTARSLLVHRREDLTLFDQAFQLFWRVPPEGYAIKLPAKTPPRRKPLVRPPVLREPKDDEGDGQPRQEQPPLLEVTQTYSANEVLRHKDFAEMSGEELAEVKHLMARLIWQLGERRTRRREPGKGHWLDMRRTVRRNLRYGGEILRWAEREPRHKPRPLVFLADISGSMERYSRLLLHFIYGLTMGLDQPVESFVFSTQLTRITRQISHKNIDQALREVGHTVNDWAGGTRIGEAVKHFNFDWGRRVLGRGAVVLIISDGWDRGEPQLLGQEMGRLHRSCHRLIWLNPLLGSAEYEPLTRGIQAALPHIDDFLPVHNLASLEDLAARLAVLKT
jgi:hypothetical protein